MMKTGNKSLCPCCKKTFKQLQRHLTKMVICKQYVEKEKKIVGIPDLRSKVNNKDSLRNNTLTSCEETGATLFPDNEDDSLYFEFEKQDTIEDELIYKEMERNQNLHEHLPSSSVASIKLLKILQEIDAPLSAYSSIMNWSAECSNLGVTFSHNYPSRDNIINRMSGLMCMSGMKPKETPLILSDNRTINVTHFDFKEMCFSILNNNFLMKDTNFTFPNENPCDYKRSKSQGNSLACIEDGSVYQTTARRLCVKPNDFCLGIKLFIDATHTDIHGNWMLDPVMFTFTFFNNNITKSEKAWRPLGFITEFGQHKIKNKTNISTTEKLQDFHSQLEIIFSSLKECQENNGFIWDLRYKKKRFRVNMKPVILLVIGDAQGNHKLTGMYGKFTEVNRVNHSCDCPWICTDDETYKCNFVKQSHIRKLCRDGDHVHLNLLSQHNIQNAFETIEIGYHPAGINALMPAEILHQMFLGLIEYALKAFFNEFGSMSQKKIDNYGKSMFTRFQHNSDRSIPIRYFRDGFTKMTKQKGSDKIGLSVIVMCCMNSKYKDTIMEGCRVGPTPNTMKKYINVLEKLIILSEWLCKDEIEISCLEQVHNNIINIMKLYKDTVRRDSIHGMKLSKFHEMLHIVRDIHLFGPPKGYDGRPGESSHKQTKMLARRTQRRTDVFEIQTGKRIYESLVIDKAYDDFATNEINDKKSFYATIDSTQRNITSSMMFLTTKNTISHPFIEDVLLGSDVFRDSCFFAIGKVGHLFNSKKIPILSYIKIDDDIQIHSHPLYKGKEEWFDWVIIKWKYENSNFEYVPARVMQIIDMRYIDTISNETYKPGLYVCILSIKTTMRKISRSNIMFSGTYERHQNQSLCFRIVELSSIHSNCFAIPDPMNFDDEEIKNCDKWLFVESRRLWSRHIET